MSQLVDGELMTGNMNALTTMNSTHSIDLLKSRTTTYMKIVYSKYNPPAYNRLFWDLKAERQNDRDLRIVRARLHPVLNYVGSVDPNSTIASMTRPPLKDSLKSSSIGL